MKELSKRQCNIVVLALSLMQEREVEEIENDRKTDG
jgi:hypothetical protein